MNPDTVILLVEDEPITAAVQKKHLEKNGFIVHHANTGERAIEMAQTLPGLHLILMDIELGDGIDGIEAAELILAKRDIPLIFLSSHTEPEIVTSIEKVSSYGYVVKNSGEAVLLASIKMAFKLYYAKKDIKEKEARFHQLAEKNKTMVWEVDKEGKYTYVSPVITSILGYEPLDLMGKKFFYDLHPEKGRKEFKEEALAIFKNHHSFENLENPVISKDGTIVWVTTNGIPVMDDEGNLKGYQGSDTDITERIEREKIISTSEQRYQFITEKTTDAIFSLNDSMHFLTANKTALNELALNSTNLHKTAFYDILHVRDGDKEFMRQVIEMKIKKMKETGKPCTVKLELLSKKTREPHDYNIMFDYIGYKNDSEILVKAVREREDNLKKFVNYERGRLIIDNYLLTAEETSKRLVANIPPVLDSEEISSIRLGIREILINAIEHGNLGISFEEKSRLLEDGSYLQHLQERQNHSEFKGRKIDIEFSITQSKAAYKITDEGNGFDHKKILEKKLQADTEMLGHGRGITLALGVFDEITYNRKGNQVLLVKHLLPEEISF